MKIIYHYLRGYPYFAIITVSIDQWCTGIGLFYENGHVSIKVFNTNIYLSSVCQSLFSLVYSFLCFYCVTEMLNLGPKKNKEFSLSCCHWNGM